MPKPNISCEIIAYIWQIKKQNSLQINYINLYKPIKFQRILLPVL